MTWNTERLFALFVLATTTNFAMTSFHQKNQILESLDSLDQGQTEKVLEYIRTLVHTRKDESAHQRLKREALKEIRLALGNDRKLRPFF